MEEDIKILEDMKTWDCILPNRRQTEAIENLINKYKELKKERDGIYADYQDLGKEKLKLEEKCEEQEKMIELMGDCIRCADLDEDIPCEHKFNCKECMIDYFTKKAKGE